MGCRAQIHCAFIHRTCIHCDTCPRCHNVLNEDNNLDWAERVKIYICIVEVPMTSLIISYTAPVQHVFFL